MDRNERARLREVITEADLLAPVASGVAEHRAATSHAGAQAQARLSARISTVHPPGWVRWRVLPLAPEDTEALGHLVATAGLTVLAPAHESAVHELARAVPADVELARPLLSLRRHFLGAQRRQEALAAAGRLVAGAATWAAPDLRAALSRCAAQAREPAIPVALTQALSPSLGLLPAMGSPTARAEVVPAPVTELAGAVPLLASVLTREQAAREQALAAGEGVREAEVTRLLAEMPVERLREATRERLRVGMLEAAGLGTVLAVLERGPALAALPGVGDVTARRMLGAAETLAALAREGARVTLDQQERTPESTELLRALHTWEVLRQAAKTTDVIMLAQALEPLAAATLPGATHLAVLADGASAADLVELVEPLPHRAAELRAALEQAGSGDPWQTFLRRPADDFALLSELGLVEETGTYGDLPEDVVDAVREHELDTSLLRVSLRGYQSFAARFALVRRKVLIGDEMGLGKTIEALAVLTHLAAGRGRWFLVVCPASVLPGWTREIGLRTRLPVRRLHGAERDEEARRWREDGGVAVTTYATLGRVWPHLESFELDALVVDEAHFIKNPSAGRSRRVRALAARTQHVILLTGTPLENKVEEFESLVRILQPDLLSGPERSPVEFRAAVAPVYLRRNVEDVLVELPELVEVDDWLELTAADLRAYRRAVRDGSFMAMRRAAFSAGPASAKLTRLVEIVEEAEENGRRVLVFSHFREVLEEVAAALPGQVFGPLTGSMPADRRQLVVDEFSAAEGGAVLVAQIQVGGVGLNIQAASVVVICEPQIKPTTEWQAIARARRMGQLESVQVHRLLAQDSVDERMVEILSGKSDIFHTFASISHTAQSAPEAYDISEADLARRVIDAERSRLLGGAEPGSPPAG